MQRSWKALLRHIANALEDRYIASLKNEHTGFIDSDIPTVIEHLNTRYGTVQATEVKEEEDTVLKLDFTPADPMVILYNPIEKLQKFATKASMPYTEEQLINFGLSIIRNTRDFEKVWSNGEQQRSKHGILSKLISKTPNKN